MMQRVQGVMHYGKDHIDELFTGTSADVCETTRLIEKAMEETVVEYKQAGFDDEAIEGKLAKKEQPQASLWGYVQVLPHHLRRCTQPNILSAGIDVDFG